MKTQKIALGGGCHWCTEAVFQSLNGVEKVEQGFVASVNGNEVFSEAVIVHFNQETIPLPVLVEIHLRTHSSTSNHAMRSKYRSAIYTFSEEQALQCRRVLQELQALFSEPLVTQVVPFSAFKASGEEVQHYYFSNPEKPFCQSFINPKLRLLLRQFAAHTNLEKLGHLQSKKAPGAKHKAKKRSQG
ncbi:peptide-methionine (S)-S-oxide reductase [Maribacter sp. 2307ULW6-5]|uniref:peptide-methionine (S)-S-oxide reductase n=1 Tax=Maribacter sp. 2307ULW6-5 TaxID=3386275 RepID=UPI0039BCF46C